MSTYLLPCDCGQKTPVSTAQAGDTVHCACGAELHVPTLRGLRELDLADRETKKVRAGWEDRHRVAFLLILVSLGCLVLAGYLWSLVPPVPEPATPEQIAEAVQNATPQQLFGIYFNMVENGLGPMQDDRLERARRLLMGGTALTVAVVVALQLAALWIVWRPRAQAKS